MYFNFYSYVFFEKMRISRVGAKKMWNFHKRPYVNYIQTCFSPFLTRSLILISSE